MPECDLEYDPKIIREIQRRPGREVIAEICKSPCRLNIISPNYTDQVISRYRDVMSHELNYYHNSLGVPALFPHFGLSLDFESPVELSLHGEDMVLGPGVKQMLKIFGVVIIRNAFLDEKVRDMGHRNRFPQLNFHVDRIESQVSCYSIYTRNPFDAVQVSPRTSSTLFIPMLVGYFQGLVERKTSILTEKGTINNAMLFDSSNIKPLLNNIVIEHAWNAPSGTGEISMIDNCNMLHASYYPDIYNKGYRIGVRYLA